MEVVFEAELVVVALIEVLLDIVVTVVELDNGLAMPVVAEQGEVKLGLRQFWDPFSLLGVASKSSLETASMRPSVLSVLGEAPEVVTSASPLVLLSGGEFKLPLLKSGLVL